MDTSDEIFVSTAALKHSLHMRDVAVGVVEMLTKTDGTIESGSAEEVVDDANAVTQPVTAYCTQTVGDESMQPVSWSSDEIVPMKNVSLFGSNIAEQPTEPNHNYPHNCHFLDSR